jgi:NAD-dependent DNA ligase
MSDIELEVMAHRYLYYVLADTAISDGIYDQLEREARATCPLESPVHGVGSSLSKDYSTEVRKLAMKLLGLPDLPHQGSLIEVYFKTKE